MAILKIKQLEERLKYGNQTVTGATATYATSSGYAGTTMYATSAGGGGTSGTAGTA